MNFEPLLQEPIVSYNKFDSVASNVWEVSTRERDLIIRTSAVEKTDVAPWTWGCYNLFGVDVRDVGNIRRVNKTLQRHTEFTFPDVLHVGTLNGQTYAVLEKLAGSRFTLKDQPDEFVKHFAACLAQLHSVGFDRIGNIEGTFSYTPSEFLVRLTHCMKELAHKYFINNQEILGSLDMMIAEALSMPVPTHGTFVMLDMDERQYIADGNHISCVDTEGYATGPCEFDIVALEYSLDCRTAASFISGYNSVRPLPKIESSRRVYRFLAGLMEIKGPVDLTSWMNYPHFLP